MSVAPSISIIIPTYNHLQDHLIPCVTSILAYTDLNRAEILIVANGCTDSTREYVEGLQKQYPERVRLVWSDQALGYTRAINLGISEARGTHVVLMNNDTELLPQPVHQWLDILFHPFIEHTNVGITGPVKFTWDCGGVSRTAMAFWLVMIPMEAIYRIGLLDPIFSPGMGEDGDFCIRLARAGYQCVGVPENVAGTFDGGIVSHAFPIFHRGNGTFADNEELKNAVVRRNTRILEDRYGSQAPPAERSSHSCERPLVSIIIPTYNHFEDALKPCLRAVFQYTDLTNKEIIVVANGCTDETIPYVQSLINNGQQHLQLITIPEPCGPIRAMNEGIAVSLGEYIVTLDNDSILQPQSVDEWIKILLKPFITPNPSPATIYSGTCVGFPVGATGPFGAMYENLGFVLHAGCAMYRREALLAVKLFDHAYDPGYLCDADISIKLWNAGYRCVEVPKDRADKFYKDGIFEINFPVQHLGHVQTMDKAADVHLIERNRTTLYHMHGSGLDLTYRGAMEQVCDGHELLPILRHYASQCSHITEFGVRGVFSTWGLLAGRPKTYIGYDIEDNENIASAKAAATDQGIAFTFHQQSTLTTTIDDTDLLYIDTHHTYGQLIQELRRHSGKVKEFILLHDTESYGFEDEAKISETEEETSKHGLRTAIDEFLQDNPRWEVYDRYHQNNGLTVLRRKSRFDISIVIPTYNHVDDLLRPCIESILQLTDMEKIEIIVSANGCTDGTYAYISELQQRLPGHFKCIWTPDAVGFTIATNKGIRAAEGRHIMLLNNDTLIQDYAPKNTWINMLFDAKKDDPKIGMVGPLQLHDFYSEVDFIVFFCALIEARMFEVVGMLDETYAPGGGEDIDFAWKIQNAGYKIARADETVYNGHTNVGIFPMWHKDNRTFGEIPEYTRSIIKRNGLLNLQRYNKNAKLNLGSGGVEVHGYVSIDLYDERAHIIHDITKLDEIIPEGIVAEILAIHVFEHLNPYYSMDILRQWYHLLKPGGRLIMEMPNIEALCARFGSATREEKYGIVNALYGSVNTTGVGNPGDITSPHLFGWWPDSMIEHLSGVGFIDIQILPEQFPHPEDNFRVEATKPIM